jgi:hypothetical protein
LPQRRRWSRFCPLNAQPVAADRCESLCELSRALEAGLAITLQRTLEEEVNVRVQITNDR